nr:cold-regulated 413 inner membrane protein 1, chloroplastic-like [Setaria viridis]
MGVLLLAKGTSIHKSFLVPFFALQAPCSIISWINCLYLHLTIIGELELLLSTMLLVSVVPYQLMNLSYKGD